MRLLNKRSDDIPAGAVYIGRPSLLGNPYPISKTTSREEAVRKYEEYFKKEMLENRQFRAYVDSLACAPALTCWCAPEKCHGDIIVQYLTGQLRLL